MYVVGNGGLKMPLGKTLTYIASEAHQLRNKLTNITTAIKFSIVLAGPSNRLLQYGGGRNFFSLEAPLPKSSGKKLEESLISRNATGKAEDVRLPKI